MEQGGIKKLSRAIDINQVNDKLKYLRLRLKEDEFQDADRLGEYGRSIPYGARFAAQPDHQAPIRRLNAFNTYCACEYLITYEQEESASDINRILDFAARKLSPNGAYYTTRTEDGYSAGSFNANPRVELNYRHTLGLGLTIAIANHDQERLNKIRSLMLTSNAQGESGGWHIWEADVGTGVDPDLVCSAYALILLDYFKRYSLDHTQYDVITRKLENTLTFFRDSLDNKTYLWQTPRNDYLETFQMSVLYYTLLISYLNKSDPDCARNIYKALGQSISPEKISLLDGRNHSFDVKVRVAYALIMLSGVGDSKYEERAIELLVEKLNGQLAVRELTTYGLTRLTILLQEIKKITSSAATTEEKQKQPLNTLGHFLGSFVRGYVGP